jgi:hypothetical protein
MPDDYPYMISNNKIGSILDRIEKAEKPPKFTYEFLKKIGFSSSNDRAVIPLLKRLEFLSDDGTPTPSYDDLKDSTRRSYILGEKIKSTYSDIYSINTNIHNSSDEEIKGAISRVTGKDAKSVNRYFLTLKALIGLAKFTPPPIKKKDDTTIKDVVATKEVGISKGSVGDEGQKRHPGFHYNIQIHLPSTTDISVYNAIFKSLKDNLFI